MMPADGAHRYNAVVAMKLYSIGHSNVDTEGFLNLLRRYDIETLVDTRSQPYSRFSPQFNKDALKRAVVEAGAEYIAMGDQLGGRPEGEEYYLATGKADYDAMESSSFYREGIERLLALAQNRRIALLCSEADFKKCHRYNLITRTLVRRGVEVSHILHTGEVVDSDWRDFEPSQLSLF